MINMAYNTLEKRRANERMRYNQNINGYRDKKLAYYNVYSKTEQHKTRMRKYSHNRNWGPKREELLEQKREYYRRITQEPKTNEQIACVLITKAKKRAKLHGREFGLTKEFVLRLLQDYTICPVLGIKDLPSLDRFDSSKGYTEDNVRIIGRRANLLKNNATIEELERILSYMKSGSGAKPCP